MRLAITIAAVFTAPTWAQPTGEMLAELARSPVPDDAKIAEYGPVLDALVDELRTEGDPHERVEMLLAKADRLVDSPAAHYVLLMKIRDLCFASDLPTKAREVANRIFLRFRVDRREIGIETLRLSAAMIRSDRTATVWTWSGLQDARLELAGDQFDFSQGRFDRATELLAELARLDVFDSPRASAVLTAAQSEFDVIGRRRQELLRFEPKDTPEYATALGLYVAAYLGDWTRGFDILRRSANPTLEKLAEAERRFPNLTADQRVRILDGWLRVAESLPDESARRNLRWRVLWGLDAAIDEIETKTRAMVVAKMLQLTRSLLPTSGHGVLTFDDPKDLDKLVIHGGDEWAIRDGQLFARSRDDHATASYDLAYSPLRAVRIRGRITSENNHNFRFTVGAISGILNWELADENHFRNLDRGEKVVTRGHLLKPGTLHEILVAAIGQDVVVFFDGRPVYTTKGIIHGAISVYPAFSDIAVQDITILGDIDPDQIVTGPRT